MAEAVAVETRRREEALQQLREASKCVRSGRLHGTLRALGQGLSRVHSAGGALPASGAGGGWQARSTKSLKAVRCLSEDHAKLRQELEMERKTRKDGRTD